MRQQIISLDMVVDDLPAPDLAQRAIHVNLGVYVSHGYSIDLGPDGYELARCGVPRAHICARPAEWIVSSWSVPNGGWSMMRHAVHLLIRIDSWNCISLEQAPPSALPGGPAEPSICTMMSSPVAKSVAYSLIFCSSSL